MACFAVLAVCTLAQNGIAQLEILPGGAVHIHPGGRIVLAAGEDAAAPPPAASPPIAPPPEPPSVPIINSDLLICGNSPIQDISGQRQALSVTGGVTVSSTQYKWPEQGSSMRFAGHFSSPSAPYGNLISVSDSLRWDEMTPSSRFMLGDAGDKDARTFTLETWAFFNDFRSGMNQYGPYVYTCLFCQGSVSFNFGVDASGVVRAYFYGGSVGFNKAKCEFTGATPCAPFKTSTQLSTGRWYHLAYVSDVASTAGWKQRIYIDGVPSAEVDYPAWALTQGQLTIGGHSSQADRSYFLDGFMSDVRVYRGYAKYHDAFAPASAPSEACG